VTTYRPAVLLAILCLSATAGPPQASDGFVDAGGIALHYRVLGEGPVVVLLHGVGGRFDEARIRFLLDALRGRYRLIGVDVRGHGESGKPHDADSYGETLADDVIRVLDHLDVRDAHVIGYSMGGIIALDAVARHPDRFRSLTLLGQGWTSIAELEQMAASADELARTDTAALPDAERGPYRRNDVLAIAALVAAYPRLAVDSAALRRLDLPVLALLGSEDPRVLRASRLRAVLPTTRIEILPGRSHGSVIDDAGYAAAIRAFLADVERVSGSDPAPGDSRRAVAR